MIDTLETSIKIDDVSTQLNSKIDKIRERFTSQSKWVIGLIFLMISNGLYRETFALKELKSLK